MGEGDLDLTKIIIILSFLGLNLYMSDPSAVSYLFNSWSNALMH